MTTLRLAANSSKRMVAGDKTKTPGQKLQPVTVELDCCPRVIISHALFLNDFLDLGHSLDTSISKY